LIAESVGAAMFPFGFHLVRRPSETLHQLLDRLEQALGPAIENQVFVDEINAPSPPPAKSIRR
jgi:hypothetical protein